MNPTSWRFLVCRHWSASSHLKRERAGTPPVPGRGVLHPRAASRILIIDVTPTLRVVRRTCLTHMKRRAFIGIAAAGAAGVVLPSLGRPAASIAAALARPHLLALFPEQVVRELGGCYRELVPAEDNSHVLADAISAGLFAGALIRPAAAGTLRAHAADQVQRDFAEGRIVTLHGWILSVTEARQCALFSLQPA
jgi:hypothetical protein